MTTMSQRPFTLWLIVLALLWGQASAYAHALGHLKNRDADKHAHVCELCVAQAHLASAAPSSSSPFLLLKAIDDWHAATVLVAPAPRLAAARARAPPAAL